jgi:hypothetical protein
VNVLASKLDRLPSKLAVPAAESCRQVSQVSCAVIAVVATADSHTKRRRAGIPGISPGGRPEWTSCRAWAKPLAHGPVSGWRKVVTVASNKDCPRCGGVSSDFVRGVCRTCYMRDYSRGHSASPVMDEQRITITHDSYGRRLCIECREPGMYAHGLCERCYVKSRRCPRMKACTCASCGVSFQSPHRDALYCSRSCRRRGRRAQGPRPGGPLP